MKDYIINLTEATLNKIISGHDANGYVIISASRGDVLSDRPHSEQEVEDANNNRYNQLKNDLYTLKYSYVPIYGGYKEMNAEKASIEKSFIVFPYNFTKREWVDFDNFEYDMLKLANKYNQEAILIKEPDRRPQYYNCIEDVWDGSPFNGVSINDVQKEYFSTLKGWKDISKNKKNRDKWVGSPQRFTYTESYINFPPATISGASMRASMGELFSTEYINPMG